MKINLDEKTTLAAINIYADDVKLLALLQFINKKAGTKYVIFQISTDEPSCSIRTEDLTKYSALFPLSMAELKPHSAAINISLPPIPLNKLLLP